MFKLFSRSKPAKTDFSGIGVDMHSHLLPGIDDGAPDPTTSIKLIRGMMELGYRRFITTPHIMWDMYKNNPAIINEKLALLRAAIAAEGMEVEIRAAAEYFLDDHVAGLLRNNEPLLTVSGNMVLCEFSLAYPSNSLKEILFDMQMQGYQPIIAHPERYLYLEANKDFYEELKDIGCLFQLNILSVAGYYGKSAGELAAFLLKNDYYDFVGTDLHGFRHLEALENPAIAPVIDKLLQRGRIRNASL